MVPSFHCSFLPDMPSSMTPGSSASNLSSYSMSTWPSPRSERLGTPKYPAIRFTRGTHFVASLVRFRYGLPGCSLPFDGSDRSKSGHRELTLRLSTGRSPFLLLGITTTSTGLLRRRDSHPLEWQLASLHQNRTCGFPAYGLYGAFFVKGASRHFCRPLSFHSFVRPAPRAFFRLDCIFPSPSRAAAVKDGASSGPPKVCP